tara:strand:- start:1162 stop:1638 length:477 start_codon:yes stop_codon:yes gene_type:complete
MKISKDSIMKKINENKPFNLITMLIYIVLISIPPILGLLWLSNIKMKACECSEGELKWMKDYIRFYFSFILGYIILSTLYVIFSGNRLKNVILGILLFIYNYISYAIIVYYVYTLKDIQCKCSYSLKKDIIYIWYIIAAIFSTLLLPGFFVLIYYLLK